MSSAQSLFDSILVKFISIFFSLSLFLSVGYMLDQITAVLGDSTFYDVSPKWAATDQSGVFINIIYIACWIPAFVAIIQPWLAAVRREEVESYGGAEAVQQPSFDEVR